MFSPFTYPTSNSFSTAVAGINPYQPQNRQEVIKVNGENGAKAYVLNTPNSSVLLLDETAPVIWLKTTDGACYPSLTAYSITPYEPEPQANTSDLVKRIERLECLINESNNTNASEQQTTECIVTDKSDQKDSKWKRH